MSHSRLSLRAIASGPAKMLAAMSATAPPKLAGDLGLRVAPVVGIGALVDGKYRVESIVGRGGMGLVVAARQEPAGTRVAVKLLLCSSGDSHTFARRALREARAASALQSEHTTRVLDVGQLDSGLPYIVMELLQGQDFERLLAERGSLSVREVATYLVQACDAIREAHARGIVHRDLKPSNLFLTTRSDGTSLVKLMDFGISKVVNAAPETSLTTTHDSPGTPRYMSPEQLLSARQVDARTDVWALGVIAFRMLTGRHPFDGETPAAVHVAIVSTPAPKLSDVRRDVPAPIVHLVDRCLAKSCAARLQTVGEFVAALLPFADADTQSRYAHLRDSIQSVSALAVPVAGAHAAGDPARSARIWRLRAPIIVGTAVVVGAAGTVFAVSRTAPIRYTQAAPHLSSSVAPAASAPPSPPARVAPEGPPPSDSSVAPPPPAVVRPSARRAKSVPSLKASAAPLVRDPYVDRK